jgi:hypothetical protein
MCNGWLKVQTIHYALTYNLQHFLRNQTLKNVQWLFEGFDTLHFATRYDL